MHFLSDSLAATLLVGALTLMLAALLLHQRDEGEDLSRHRATAGRTASLEMHVVTDFKNVVSLTSATDSTVVFQSVGDVSTMSTRPVTYHRKRRVVGTDTLYDVERREGADVALIARGLTEWRVDLKDAAGAPTATLGTVRRVTVRFATPPAFPTAQDTLRSVWERTFAPALLGDATY